MDWLKEIEEDHKRIDEACSFPADKVAGYDLIESALTSVWRAVDGLDVNSRLENRVVRVASLCVRFLLVHCE